jgi:hypothetical protein
MSEAPGYELSDNQQKFVSDAESQGLDVDYTYSGRFMYGQQCPCVKVDSAHEFNTEATCSTDNLGLGFVIYAQV